jgi:hypothetical protein
MTRNDQLSSYRQLPVRPDAPPGSSWGLWGDDLLDHARRRSVRAATAACCKAHACQTSAAQVRTALA